MSSSGRMNLKVKAFFFSVTCSSVYPSHNSPKVQDGHLGSEHMLRYIMT